MNEAGESVVAFQPRVTLREGIVIIASRQHTQDVLDGQVAAANDRFAAIDPLQRTISNALFIDTFPRRPASFRRRVAALPAQAVRW